MGGVYRIQTFLDFIYFFIFTRPLSFGWFGFKADRGTLSTPSHRIVSYRIVSYRIVSCRVVSCRVVSCRVVSCRVVSCRVVS